MMNNGANAAAGTHAGGGVGQTQKRDDANRENRRERIALVQQVPGAGNDDFQS